MSDVLVRVLSETNNHSSKGWIYSHLLPMVRMMGDKIGASLF